MSGTLRKSLLLLLLASLALSSCDLFLYSSRAAVTFPGATGTTVSGTVRYEGGTEGLEGVEVRANYRGGKVTYTDADGAYSLAFELQEYDQEYEPITVFAMLGVAEYGQVQTALHKGSSTGADIYISEVEPIVTGTAVSGKIDSPGKSLWYRIDAVSAQTIALEFAMPATNLSPMVEVIPDFSAEDRRLSLSQQTTFRDANFWDRFWATAPLNGSSAISVFSGVYGDPGFAGASNLNIEPGRYYVRVCDAYGEAIDETNEFSLTLFVENSEEGEAGDVGVTPALNARYSGNDTKSAASANPLQRLRPVSTTDTAGAVTTDATQEKQRYIGHVADVDWFWLGQNEAAGASLATLPEGYTILVEFSRDGSVIEPDLLLEGWIMNAASMFESDSQWSVGSASWTATGTTSTASLSMGPYLIENNGSTGAMFLRVKDLTNTKYATYYSHPGRNPDRYSVRFALKDSPEHRMNLYGGTRVEPTNKDYRGSIGTVLPANTWNPGYIGHRGDVDVCKLGSSTAGKIYQFQVRQDAASPVSPSLSAWFRWDYFYLMSPNPPDARTEKKVIWESGTLAGGTDINYSSPYYYAFPYHDVGLNQTLFVEASGGSGFCDDTALPFEFRYTIVDDPDGSNYEPQNNSSPAAKTLMESGSDYVITTNGTDKNANPGLGYLAYVGDVDTYKFDIVTTTNPKVVYLKSFSMSGVAAVQPVISLISGWSQPDPGIQGNLSPTYFVPSYTVPKPSNYTLTEQSHYAVNSNLTMYVQVKDSGNDNGDIANSYNFAVTVIDNPDNTLGTDSNIRTGGRPYTLEPSNNSYTNAGPNVINLTGSGPQTITLTRYLATVGDVDYFCLWLYNNYDVVMTLDGATPATHVVTLCRSSQPTSVRSTRTGPGSTSMYTVPDGSTGGDAYFISVKDSSSTSYFTTPYTLTVAVTE